MPDKVIAGAKVVTSDGKELGTVKEAEDRAFHVDAPRQFDYWLQSSVVKSASADMRSVRSGAVDSDDMTPYSKCVRSASRWSCASSSAGNRIINTTTSIHAAC